MFRKRLVKFPLPDLVKGAKNKYEQIKALKKEKEKSAGEEEGYLAVGRIMIAKKFLLFVGIAVMIAAAVIVWLQINKLEESRVRTFFYESNKLEAYSGNAKITDLSGQVLYEGEVKDGVCEGNGRLYDFEGNLIYEGGFVKNDFEGNGIFYNQDGSIWYEGEFAKNVFEGSGKLYLSHTDGTYVTGTFAGGEFIKGYGELFDETENLRYIGELSGYVYEGIGRLYDENGSDFVYEGGFIQGFYEGSGTLYQDGYCYSGDFAAGKYDGNGTLYDLIADSMVYEGSFATGLYEGEGILHDPINRCILYEGSFHKGLYEGMGKLYQTGGELLEYEGGFRAGIMAGEGIFYDKNGRKAANGPVSGGQLDFLAFLYMETEKIQEAFYGKLLKNNFYEEITFLLQKEDKEEETTEVEEESETEEKGEIEEIEEEKAEGEQEKEEAEKEPEEKKGSEVEEEKEAAEESQPEEAEQPEEPEGSEEPEEPGEPEEPKVLYSIYSHKTYKVSFVEDTVILPGKCIQLFVYDGTLPNQVLPSEGELAKAFGSPKEQGDQDVDIKTEFILKKLNRNYLNSLYVITYEYQEMNLSFYFKTRGGSFLFYGCEDLELTED